MSGCTDTPAHVNGRMRSIAPVEGSHTGQASDKCGRIALGCYGRSQMERSLAQVALPSRRIGVVGFGIGLGACALGLAGAGLVAGADGLSSWSSMLLAGSSLVTAAAAGFAVAQTRDSATEPSGVLGQQGFVQLLGDAGDGVWDYDLRTQRIVYNAACATMLGYAGDEISSTLSQWGTLVHEDDLQDARRALDDYLDGRSEHYRVEVRMLRKDGGWSRVLDCGRVVARDERGRPQRACGIHRILPDAVDRREVAAAVGSDLDQALAGLLGQATLAAAPGEGAELERAAWRCVGLANRIKFANAEHPEAPAATDVVAVTRGIVEHAEQWTPSRVTFRVRTETGAATAVVGQGVFQCLAQLGIDDAVEQMDLEGGRIELRLHRTPNLTLSIVATSTRPRRGDENKRHEAIRSLAARHGIEVSSIAGELRLVWPRRA